MGTESSAPSSPPRKPKSPSSFFHEILIVIHGARKTGKSSLLRRMNAENFIPQYTPTRFMQATELFWHPVSRQSDTVKITVWDVVDKAIQANPEVKRNKELPDASTVDTISRADGVIVLYDPRVEESIYYALDVVDRTPKDKPLIILANFSDEIKSPEEVHPLMKECAMSRFHLAASMKMNTGLAELATWLDLPLNVSLERMYKLHLDESERVVNELMQELGQCGFTHPEEVIEKELAERVDMGEEVEPEKPVSEEENLMLPTVEQPVNEASFFSDGDDDEDMEAFLKAHPNAKINLDVLKKTEEEEEKREKKEKKAKVLAKKAPAKIVIKQAEKKQVNPVKEEESEQKDSVESENQAVNHEIPTIDVGDDFFGTSEESDEVGVFGNANEESVQGEKTHPLETNQPQIPTIDVGETGDDFFGTSEDSGEINASDNVKNEEMSLTNVNESQPSEQAAVPSNQPQIPTIEAGDDLFGTNESENVKNEERNSTQVAESDETQVLERETIAPNQPQIPTIDTGETGDDFFGMSEDSENGQIEEKDSVEAGVSQDLKQEANQPQIPTIDTNETGDDFFAGNDKLDFEIEQEPELAEPEESIAIMAHETKPSEQPPDDIPDEILDDFFGGTNETPTQESAPESNTVTDVPPEIPTLDEGTLNDEFFSDGEKLPSSDLKPTEVPKPLPTLSMPDYSLSSFAKTNDVKFAPSSDLDLINGTVPMPSEVEVKPSTASGYETFSEYESFTEAPAKKHHGGRKHKSHRTKRSQRQDPPPPPSSADYTSFD